MAVASDSRFKFTPLINYKGSEVFGEWVKPDFLTDPTVSYSQYQVPNGREGRTDLISQDVYGTPEYFWVIIAYNHVREPLNWPKAGDIINIPNAANIFSEM